MQLYPCEFGVKGSEQKRVRDRSIVQGTVLGALHGEPSSSRVARAENSAMMIGRPDRLYMD